MAERYSRNVETYSPGTRAIMRDKNGELPHFCFPLTDPRWLAAGEAALMRPDDPVLGLEFDGGAWALPWWIMKNHHIANLELQGRPVLVTLCEACSSGAAFDPVLEGRRHNFRLEGLYNGTIMPLDYETESRWTGFTGEAIDGPMKGRVMERLPLFQCTWEEWLALHPATLVPDGRDESRIGHGEGHFPGGPIVTARFRNLLSNIDKRLPHYEMVLGVMSGDAGRCYPLATLASNGRVLNDQLGGRPIAVFWQPGTWLASAYERSVEGQSLTFRTEGETIVDEQTASRWEVSGMAVSGPLRGRRLKYLHSGVEEFHIWAAFHPATTIHGRADDAAAPAVWSADLVPQPVHDLLTRQWWLSGMRLLAIGCGDGLTAAWAAESGLRVTGVDADAALIERARSNFGRLPGLELRAESFTSAAPDTAQFDALYDYGLFFRLAPDKRAAYVANAAAAAKPGARFLVLLPVPPENAARLAAAVAETFAASFHLVDWNPAPLPHPKTGATVPGVAIRLLRSGWLAG